MESIDTHVSESSLMERTVNLSGKLFLDKPLDVLISAMEGGSQHRWTYLVAPTRILIDLGRQQLRE